MYEHLGQHTPMLLLSPSHLLNSFYIKPESGKDLPLPTHFALAELRPSELLFASVPP